MATGLRKRRVRVPNQKARTAARAAARYDLDNLESHEVAALISLTRRAYRVPGRPGTLVTRVIEDEGSVRSDLARGVTIMVARSHGGKPRLLGAVRLVEDRGALFFSRLAVAPAARGRGLGAALVGAAESSARAWGLDEVRCDVALGKDLIGFYERLGYEVEHEYLGPGGLAKAQLVKRL